MNNKPEISVILTAYNAEKYIGKTIESILNQTMSDFELIIINDGSKDETATIIGDYGKKDSRIITITNNPNKGIAETQNIGLRLAKGKYIASHDNDDLSMSNRLEVQYQFMENHPEVFLVGAGIIPVFPDGTRVNEEYAIITGYENIKTKLPQENCVWSPTFFFRNTDKYFFRKKFVSTEDYDFLLNILSEGDVIENIDQKLLYYTVRPESISHAYEPMTDEFANIAKEFYWQRINKGKDNYDEFKHDEIIKKHSYKTGQ